MAIKYNTVTGSCATQSSCVDKFGCPKNQCPDFILKRHDTGPVLKVSVEDCDGPIDVTDGTVKVTMYAKSKLKKAITDTDFTIAFADDIGFEQVNAGDILIFPHTRSPEVMYANEFDEINKTIGVSRGHSGTTARAWKLGTALNIIRINRSNGEVETVTESKVQIDGTTKTVTTKSYIKYTMAPQDALLPGCYWLEFTLIKQEVQTITMSGTPTGGTFTLNYDGHTSADLVYNSTSAQVQSALEGLATVDTNNVICSGGPFPASAIIVKFQNILLGTNAKPITASSTGLTGGTSPSISVETTTQGSLQRFPVDSEDGYLVKINDSPLGPSFVEPKVNFVVSGGAKNGGGGTIVATFIPVLSGGASCGSGATIA